MAIQPIDLSTMYSQMGNVAKNVANIQQGTQLTQAMQESVVIRDRQEQAAQVHRAADSQTDTSQIKTDSEGNDAGTPQQSSGRKRKEDNNNSEPAEPKITEIREPYLGQHIDISR